MKINVKSGLISGLAEYTADTIDHAVAVINGEDVTIDDVAATSEGAVVTISFSPVASGRMTGVNVFDDDDVELVGGAVDMNVLAGQQVKMTVSFADLEQSDIRYTQQPVMDETLVNSVNWALVAQFDATYFDTIEISASGISLKIWDYDDHETALFQRDFPSVGETVKVKVTDEMRGILEFHVKGSGVINSAIAYKGEKV